MSAAARRQQVAREEQAIAHVGQVRVQSQLPRVAVGLHHLRLANYAFVLGALAKTIVDTLVGHERDKQQDMFALFGDPQHSITDQVLHAYEHADKWVNRLMLGDSLVVAAMGLRIWW